jgi:hypothetical protein
MIIGAVNIALVLGLMALTSAGVIGTASIGSPRLLFRPDGRVAGIGPCADRHHACS